MAFMKVFRRIKSSLVLISGLTAISLCAISVQARPSQHVLQKDVRTVVAQGKAKQVGALTGSQSLQLAIQLPLHNQSELTEFLSRLNNPSSPDFRKYLTVEEFTRLYGPSEDDYQKVVDFAKRNGFTVANTHKNRLVLDVSGTVEQVQNAFHVIMKLYQHPHENRTFFSVDRAPSIAADLPISHIGGLDNYATGHSSIRAGNPGAPGDTSSWSGSGPGGSYLGSDMRAAYYGGTNLTGAGQCVALLEAGGYQMSDVTASFNGVPYIVPINNVYVAGATGAVDPNIGDAEQVMDIVAAIGMAPGLSQVRVYEMPNDSSFGYADIDAFNQMATENLCKQISSSFSWEAGDGAQEDPIFQEFAAQGQTYFNVSMDSGAYSNFYYNYPQDDPWVIGVGATDLTTSGPGGSWVSESAWNYSGGGPNNDGVPIPSWQVPVINASNNGSTTLRNVPDVAMEGNTDNYLCVNGGSCGAWGGTSIATPRWAAFTALVNQQAAQSNLPPVGFIAPLIYSLGQASGYNSQFHDIVSGSNGCCGQTLFYNAVTGYDLVTGWGSPNGQAMINALIGADVPNFLLSSSPSAVTVNAGGSNSTTIAVADEFGFDGNVTLSVTGLPSGFTATFSPNPTTNHSILTLMASSAANISAPANVTITGASGNLSASTVVQVADQANCTQTPITPWVQVNGAAWQSAASVTVAPGATVNLGPQAGSGTWSWTGPSGYTATTGEIDSIPLSGGDNTYVATYTAPGGCVSTLSFDVTVYTTPNFTISDASASLVLAQGGSSSSTIDLSSINSFSAATQLSVSGLPAGVTASFNPASVAPTANGTGQTTLVLNASSSATAGSATITITGTSGTLINSTTVPLNVVNASVACTPLQTLPWIEINNGAWLNESEATVGSGATVNLDFDTLSSGGTYIWSGPNGYSATSTTTNTISSIPLSAGTNAYNATYIDSNNCASTQTFVITQVTTPSFVGQALPSALALQQGGAAIIGVSITSLNGFNAATDLTVSGLPAGVSASFSSNLVTPTANGTASAILTLNASSSAALGETAITINAVSGSTNSSSSFSLTIGANACVATAMTPWILSSTANGVWQSVYDITVPYSATVDLGPQPSSGVWIWNGPNGYVSISSGSGEIDNVSLTNGANTYTATYTNGNGCQTTAPFVVTTTSATTFALSAAPASVTVPQSGNASTTVTLNSLNGFDSATTLGVSGLPAGITANFSPASVTLPANGTATTTLTLSASSQAAPGNYTVSITGTSGSLESSTSLPVVVPAFTVAAPATVTATQGGTTGPSQDVITVNGQYGFSSSVNLNISGLPSGVTAAFSTQSVTPGSSGSATLSLTFTAASGAAAGAYPLVITSASSSPAQTFSTNQLLIVSTPNCTVSTITPYIWSSSTNGWTSAYDLAVPYGSTVNLGPQPSDGTWSWSGPNGFNVTQSSAEIDQIPLSIGTNTYVGTYVNSAGCASTGTFVITESAPTPDFTVAAAPVPVTVSTGGSGSATITLASNNGFSSAVALSLANSALPSGVTASFAPATVTPEANGGTTASLTFNVGVSAPAGTFMIPVSGTSGSLIHSATAVLVVNQSTPASGGQTINGVCGSDNGGTFASLSSTDPNLCSAGTVSAFTGNGPWTWSCAGSNGGSTVTTCAASVQSLTAPTIALAFSPASVAVGGTSTLTVTLSNSNLDPLRLNSVDVTITSLPGGATLSVPGSNPTIACSDGSGANDPPIVIPAQSHSTPGTCTLTFANVSVGSTANTYTATWPSDIQFTDAVDLTNTINTSATSTATLTVTSAATPIDGACGSDNGGTFTSLSSTDPNLCSSGAASAFIGNGPWTWSCAGSNGGSLAQCSAKAQSQGGGTGGVASAPALSGWTLMLLGLLCGGIGMAWRGVRT
jgi:subtilase family serine protease